MHRRSLPFAYSRVSKQADAFRVHSTFRTCFTFIRRLNPNCFCVGPTPLHPWGPEAKSGLWVSPRSVPDNKKIYRFQWRSQALKLGWEQWSEGLKSRSRVQGRSPGGGLGAKPRSQIYNTRIQTICSCQMVFYAGLLPSPSSIFPTPPTTTPKTNCSDLHESHAPTGSRKGEHATVAHPCLRYWPFYRLWESCR